METFSEVYNAQRIQEPSVGCSGTVVIAGRALIHSNPEPEISDMFNPRRKWAKRVSSILSRPSTAAISCQQVCTSNGSDLDVPNQEPVLIFPARQTGKRGPMIWNHQLLAFAGVREDVNALSLATLTDR